MDKNAVKGFFDFTEDLTDDPGKKGVEAKP